LHSRCNDKLFEAGKLEILLFHFSSPSSTFSSPSLSISP